MKPASPPEKVCHMPEAHEPIEEHEVPHLTDDEKHLARLGYAQELNRSWSGFSNFAISFSWTWPILGLLILNIGFTMSELVSAYPTSGGIYWWASKLGGPAAGFYTGWLNLIGLVAVTAGVAYGCATFLDLTIGTISSGWAD